MKKIIFNADVGEEAGFDDQIMPYVSWCNIACGSHAGNDLVIQKTIELAMRHNVKIGAHPSYPDRDNFGRVSMNIPNDDLVKTLTEQIIKVKLKVEKFGGVLHHVKPHGALYNDAVKKEEIASSIFESVKNIDKRLYVISLKDSRLSYLCKDVLDVKYEAFADRNYNEDLSLVSRSNKEAVITNSVQVFDHVLKMVSEGKIKTITGEELPVLFDTICVHGDNPNSLNILRHMYDEFSKMNYILK
ncbi:5-oxoprolinase subunit PxpA [Aquimarina sp. AU474]|uniref:5-oxoprolinase subunit PxpA n=1 Tax=Aquimarina sp. AU474 TaxID=2108529 RepID=UPI000D68DD4B|nr:5-oxoprolinase subunit PxpA [Aquimarina sp. AU474]